MVVTNFRLFFKIQLSLAVLIHLSIFMPEKSTLRASHLEPEPLAPSVVLQDTRSRFTTASRPAPCSCVQINS